MIGQYAAHTSAMPDAVVVRPSAASAHADASARAASVAFAGAALLTVAAPFETLEPLVRLPGQSISNLEAAMLVAFAAWGAAVAASRRLPVWRTPLVLPWMALLLACAVSSLASPVSRVNALHMTGRLGAAFGVYLLAVNGVTTASRLRRAIVLAIATACVVSLLAILEYFRVAVVLQWLKQFRPSVTEVGALVRAGGPLYATIASMYLEIVFALGLGLLLWTLDSGRRAWTAAAFAALLAIAEAIALTFTRAGWIAMAASLAWVVAARFRGRGVDAGVRLLIALAVAVAALFVTSRSAEAMWLRLTSESQESWYRAAIDAPAALTFAPGAKAIVPVRVTNTGRLTWDSDDDSPFFFSYHWRLLDSDRYAAFEGIRTRFETAVQPAASTVVLAEVQAPRRPGRYRLVWDITQEHRLWFSTEPGAVPATTVATIEGTPSTAPVATTPPTPPFERPGRLTLWRAAVRMFAAHPLLGVGPDNFRLSYGGYAGLRRADARVHSNNMYLEMLAGGGLLAGAAFAWLLVRAGRVLRGEGALAAGVAAACVAIAVHGAFDSFLSFAPTYVMFALVLGYADAHRV